MKIDRHGKAKVFSQAEIQRLFNAGLLTTRDKTLCAVMLYTGCRVNEAVTLKVTDVYDKKGRIRSELIIRKGNTKGKLATRTIPVLDDLRRFLEQYKPKKTSDGYLFPGRWGRGHLHIAAIKVCGDERMSLQGTVGSLGYTTNQPRNQSLSIFGYPVLSPFNGKEMISCPMLSATDENGYIPKTIGIECNMTAGSSGGPWIAKYNPGGGGSSNYINGVTSYQCKPNLQKLCSPYFGDEFLELYSTAISNGA